MAACDEHVYDSDDAESLENEDSDSDRELQVAFAEGKLKPGLNIPVEVHKKGRKDVPGLEAAWSQLYLDRNWLERLDVVQNASRTSAAINDLTELNNLEDTDVHDDFKREMKFYRQAQQAVLHAIPKLHKLKVPTKRPDDYFAEMVKSEDHMKKVREKLVTKKMRLEQREKVRKLRDLKKQGKKIQQNVLLQRQKEKKAVLDSVKKFKKGKEKSLDFLNDSENPASAAAVRKKRNKKRDKKNQQYGFGGRKKGMKHNTAKSSASMSSFNRQKHSSTAARGKGNKVMKKRPGKQQRQKMKSKKS